MRRTYHSGLVIPPRCGVRGFSVPVHDLPHVLCLLVGKRRGRGLLEVVAKRLPHVVLVPHGVPHRHVVTVTYTMTSVEVKTTLFI